MAAVYHSPLSVVPGSHRPRPAVKLTFYVLWCLHQKLLFGRRRTQIILESAARPLCTMLQANEKQGVEAAAWLMGYLATDPANGRPLIAMGAAPALVRFTPSSWSDVLKRLLLCSRHKHTICSAVCSHLFSNVTFDHL